MNGLRLPILELALAAFATGTTEFVIIGILPHVARDEELLTFLKG